MRIALSTGGGDAPGLNAVIRAVVLSAHQRGWESFGISRGYEGLLRPSGSDAGLIPLGPDSVRGITHLGGTILGTTNRGNPFRWTTTRDDGTLFEEDRSEDLVQSFRAHRLDALVAIGGDGSLGIAYELFHLRVRQRGRHRHRRPRQGPHHRRKPRPGVRRGADGTVRRVDRAA